MNVTACTQPLGWPGPLLLLSLCAATQHNTKKHPACCAFELLTMDRWWRGKQVMPAALPAGEDVQTHIHSVDSTLSGSLHLFQSNQGESICSSFSRRALHFFPLMASPASVSFHPYPPTCVLNMLFCLSPSASRLPPALPPGGARGARAAPAAGGAGRRAGGAPVGGWSAMDR